MWKGAVSFGRKRKAVSQQTETCQTPVQRAVAACGALGVPLAPFALTVLVLLAALPSASNVSLLAEKFGAHNGRIARIILVSTALAFVSFSAAVALLT